MIKSLLDKLMNICRYHAYRTRGRVTPDELLGYAYEGWRDALKRWRPEGGAGFKTFSQYHIRNRINQYTMFMMNKKNWRDHRPVESLPDDWGPGGDYGAGASRTRANVDMNAALQLIAGLRGNQRWAVELVCVGGLSCTEAAGVIGCSLQNVSRHVIDGLRKTRLRAGEEPIAAPPEP